MSQSSPEFKRDLLLYAVSAAAIYVGTVPGPYTVQWWAGIVGVVTTVVKGKLSPGKDSAPGSAEGRKELE